MNNQRNQCPSIAAKSWGKMTKAGHFSAIVIFVLLLLIMLIIKNDYLSAINIYTLAQVGTVTALVGFSQMVYLACGGLNLSIGSIGVLTAVITGWAMTDTGLPWWVGVLIGLAAGLICGVINGLLIYRAGGVGGAFFLITLATASVYQGLNLMLTSGMAFYGRNGTFDQAFMNMGNYKIIGLPASILVVLIIAVILAFIYRKLSIGRQMFAYGSNYKAAELHGISKFKVIMTVNVLGGVLATIAGIFAMIRIEAAQPSMGSNWMLVSFAVPLIGGTRQTGGKCSIIGAIFGAFVLAIISNALVHLKVNVYWNELIYGVIIFVSVTIDRIRYIKR